MCEVSALNQLSADDRKGRRKRTEGRVKPWSCTSSGGGASGLVFVACERRSLFFRTRRRFLGMIKDVIQVREVKCTW